jgi:uncharacterized membrane protein YvbJ
MKLLKSCPICGSKASKHARICYECYYRFSDRSTQNVAPENFRENLIKQKDIMLFTQK